MIRILQRSIKNLNLTVTATNVVSTNKQLSVSRILVPDLGFFGHKKQFSNKSQSISLQLQGSPFSLSLSFIYCLPFFSFALIRIIILFSCAKSFARIFFFFFVFPFCFGLSFKFCTDSVSRFKLFRIGFSFLFEFFFFCFSFWVFCFHGGYGWVQSWGSCWGNSQHRGSWATGKCSHRFASPSGIQFCFHFCLTISSMGVCVFFFLNSVCSYRSGLFYPLF